MRTMPRASPLGCDDKQVVTTMSKWDPVKHRIPWWEKKRGGGAVTKVYKSRESIKTFFSVNSSATPLTHTFIGGSGCRWTASKGIIQPDGRS